MKSKIALYCGVPPTCDRCAEADAKVEVKLDQEFGGTRSLCERCLISLIQNGLAEE